MKTKEDTTPTGADAGNASAEPCNVAVIALKNRTKIGKALVAAGPVDFPLTMSDAKALEAMGLVQITGLFATA